MGRPLTLPSQVPPLEGLGTCSKTRDLRAQSAASICSTQVLCDACAESLRTLHVTLCWPRAAVVAVVGSPPGGHEDIVAHATGKIYSYHKIILVVAIRTGEALSCKTKLIAHVLILVSSENQTLGTTSATAGEQVHMLTCVSSAGRNTAASIRFKKRKRNETPKSKFVISARLEPGWIRSRGWCLAWSAAIGRCATREKSATAGSTTMPCHGYNKPNVDCCQ